MKLGLVVSKRYVERPTRSGDEVVLAVVDFDKADHYPLNFVCILPKDIESSHKFLEIYGEESKAIATKLLTKALVKQEDLLVRAEIENRLKDLKPKPTAKCTVCGCVFDPKKFGGFRQRVCYSCRNKGSPNK